ncbi:MAG: hypothetical protein ABUL73_06650 [Alphaproteobacteria bacterium]
MSGLDQTVIAEALVRLGAVSGDRAFDVAQLQLTSLPEIIAAAGPHWQALKDKLRQSSIGFLKACLDDEDFVAPAGDGLLIVFGGGDQDTLKQRAEELRGLLLEFYLGQDGLKKLGIVVQHRRMLARELQTLLAPPAPAKVAATIHKLMFAPLWSAKPGVIASYLCAPIYEARDGRRYGYDRGFADGGECTIRDYCELDLRALDLVAQALGRYGPEQVIPAIGASVHSTTLQNRTLRGAYFERLGRFDPERAKNIFLKVAEIEPGTPMMNLADWVVLLRKRVRNVLLEFHGSEQNAPDLVQIGAWGAGYQAPGAANRDGADLAPAALRLKRWGESIARQRARFFVDNARRPELISLAVETGAHFITSDPYWPFQTWPGHVVSAIAPAISHFSPTKKPLTSAAS